jgi:quinol-cytochrome oxidoreductase complex cytochrome b subunit
VLTPAKHWLEERLRLGALRDFLAHKMVPMHRHSIWYYVGGITLFLFGIQVVTGILLLLYYRPTPEGAFESVQFIMTQVPFGWVIRSVHSWAANLLVLAAFIHLFSVYFMRGYRRPREVTWLSGIVLLGLMLAFGFSGYLLPWNELAFFATKVGTDIVGALPWVGQPLMIFLRGGEEVTGATLTRLFGFHVAVLPMIATLVLIVHLALVQVHGMSEPLGAKERPERPMPFYPHFMLREGIVWLAVLALLLGLATYLPWELGVKADLFASAPAGIRPEWYFTFLSQSLKYLPPQIFGVDGETVGIVAFAIGGLLFALVPFLDRRARKGERSFLVTAFGIAVIAFMAVMITLAYVKPY